MIDTILIDPHELELALRHAHMASVLARGNAALASGDDISLALFGEVREAISAFQDARDLYLAVHERVRSKFQGLLEGAS